MAPNAVLSIEQLLTVVMTIFLFEGAWWRSGRASDSESRGPGFDPHRRRHVVSLSKTH